MQATFASREFQLLFIEKINCSHAYQGNKKVGTGNVVEFIVGENFKILVEGGLDWIKI